MRVLLSFVAFAFYWAVVRANENPEASVPGVLDLNPSNIDSVIGGKRHAFVEFYAPWCGHCKKLTPEYKKLAEMITKSPKLSSRVTIAKVNADEHRSIGEAHGVEGFPTLLYFAPETTQGENYQNRRSAQDMFDFIEEKVLASRDYAQVDALNPIAKIFVERKADPALIAEAEKIAATVDEDEKDNAALYIRLMKKAHEKGVDYLSKELTRLEKIMATNDVSVGQGDVMNRKIAILNAFFADDDDEDLEDDI